MNTLRTFRAEEEKCKSDDFIKKKKEEVLDLLLEISNEIAEEYEKVTKVQLENKNISLEKSEFPSAEEFSGGLTTEINV